MFFADKINAPGEHHLLVHTKTGQLEGVLTVPEQANIHYAALLGHPHSLQGGTMNNKVVTTMSRVFKELGVASIRFNFRGVGQSSGIYDEGVGESEDMLLLARRWRQAIPDVHFIFAGFSFGSYVAYRAAAQCEHVLLITIAPAVHHHDYKEFSQAPAPWIVIQGDDDELVPLHLVLNFATQVKPALPVLRLAETGHFFHGKLVDLKWRLIEAVRTQVEF